MKSYTKLNFSILIMLALVSFVMLLTACSDDEEENTQPTTPSNTNVNLNSGLVAHYQFNQNLTDATGNFLMQSTNNMSYGENRTGTASASLEFDSLNNNQHAWVEDSIFKYGTDFSISYWFYLDTVNQSLPQYLITSRFTKSGNEQGGVDMAVSNKFSLALRTNTSSLFARAQSDDGSIMAKRWYHVVAQQENEVVSLYLDKLLIDKDTISSFSPNVFPQVSHWAFGSAINASLNILREMDGKLDDIRFYDRAINQDEINALNAEN